LESKILSNLAEDFATTGRREAAEEAFRSSIVVSDVIGDTAGAARTALRLAQYVVSLGRVVSYEQSLMLRKARIVFAELGCEDEIQEVDALQYA
jgi:hypothetical protein